MATEKFLVPGISCQHCVNAVNKEVSALSGVQKVEIDLPSKVVTVYSDQVASAVIIAAIQEAGYDEVSPVA